MFKEKLLLGQFYPVDSPIHRLNAKAKLIAAFIYMVALFVTDNWYGWGLLALFCLAVIVVSRIPFHALWRGMKLIIILSLLTMVLNFFFYAGETVIWSWRSLSLTVEGIVYGLGMGLRLILLVLFASLLTLTTAPIQLTDGLEGVMKPLTRWKVPAHEIAMMMSIALRFIPTILDEFDRIVLAQRSRGARVGQGRGLQKLTSFVPLLVPLFVASFRRAEDLAQAMEAKCYRGGDGRTRWKTQPWQVKDSLAVGLVGALLLALIVERLL